MMILGVVLHTALVYLPTDDWLYQDPDRSPFLSVFLVQVIHIFRMPVFFVMAGFFGAMLFERRGAGSFSLHRFDRIVIPLVVGWFVLYPLVVWSISFAMTYSSIPAGDGALAVAFERMSLNADFAEAGPLHLWFLYYLIYYYIAFGLLTKLFQKFGGPLVGIFRSCTSALAGRRVVLDRGRSLKAIANSIKNRSEASEVRIARAPERPRQHKVIGLCVGSGGSLLDEAIAQGCTVFITGEMSHHDLLKAQSSGCTVILAGHTETERCYLPVLAERLEGELGAACPKISISRQDRPPLRRS